MRLLLLVLSGCLVGCGGDATDPSPAQDTPAPQPSASPEPESPSRGGERLNVPPEQIHRARREAAGLERLTAGLREQTLRARNSASLTYGELREEAATHAHAAVSFAGRIGLSRPAGDRLWILALSTRREGDRWRDPLYVLSVVDPELPPEGGVEARVWGWVVGERRIGRYELPLIVAYAVTPLSDSP